MRKIAQIFVCFSESPNFTIVVASIELCLLRTTTASTAQYVLKLILKDQFNWLWLLVFSIDEHSASTNYEKCSFGKSLYFDSPPNFETVLIVLLVVDGGKDAITAKQYILEKI